MLSASRRFSRSMPPAKWVECVRMMSSSIYASGDIIYPPGSIGASIIFLEAGQAMCYGGVAGETVLNHGEFYGEDTFIITLSMMVEDDVELTTEAAANTQRKSGMQAVSECHVLELGIKDVFKVFGGNRKVLRQIARKLQLTEGSEFMESLPGLLPPQYSVHQAAPPSPLARRQHQSFTNHLPTLPLHLGESREAGSSCQFSCASQGTCNDFPQSPKAHQSRKIVSCLMKRCIPKDRWAQCVRGMKHVIFPPGEVIISSETLGTSMYFVDAGRCRYIGEDRCIAELSEGDFFGETAFVNTLRIMLEIEGGETVNNEHYAQSSRRNGSVLAVDKCSCLELSIKDVFDAFDGKDKNMLKNALLFMDTPLNSQQAAAARFSSERERSLQGGSVSPDTHESKKNEATCNYADKHVPALVGNSGGGG